MATIPGPTLITTGTDHDAPDVGAAKALVRFWHVPSASAIAWISMIALAAVRAGTTEERDPYWQARAGIENLHGLPLARPDTWSWDGVGGDWYQNSPAWNDVLGLSWLVGGFWGMYVVGFGTILTLFGLSYVIARRLGAHPLGALAAVVLSFIGALPMVSARATMAVQVLLLIGVCIPPWWRPRVLRHSPIVNALVLAALGTVLAAVGNWVHLSFLVLGPALAGSWGVYWLFSDWPGDLRSRLRDARRWALVVGGTVGVGLGTLAGPYGIATVIERSRATSATCASEVLEWASPFSSMVLTHMPTVIQWPTAAACAILTCVLFVRWWTRRVRSGRIDETFARASAIATLALPLTIAGMFMLRFLGASFLTFAPVVGLGITAAAWRLKAWASRLADDAPYRETALRWTQSRSWRIVLTLVWVLLAPWTLLLGPGQHAVPPELAAIKALPEGCSLFTNAGISGPAVLVRRDVKVWLDGRADYYGNQRLIDDGIYYKGLGSTTTPAGATCVIIPASDMSDISYPETQRLAADPSWTLIGTYEHLGVWVRSS